MDNNLDETGFPSFEIDENFNQKEEAGLEIDKQDSVAIERKSTKVNELKESIVSNQIGLKKSRLYGHRLSELLDPTIQFFSQSSVVENQQKRKITEIHKSPRVFANASE